MSAEFPFTKSQLAWSFEQSREGSNSVRLAVSTPRVAGPGGRLTPKYRSFVTFPVLVKTPGH